MFHTGAVASICWSSSSWGEDAVLLSLVSPAAGVMFIPAPTAPAAAPHLGYSTRELPTRVLALETALAAIGAPEGAHWGTMVGLGVDKQVHKVMLPADAIAWEGLEGRLYKAMTKVGLLLLLVVVRMYLGLLPTMNSREA